MRENEEKWEMRSGNGSFPRMADGGGRGVALVT